MALWKRSKMLETICHKCRQRYPLGQDHTCPKKSTAPRKDVVRNRLGTAGSTPAISINGDHGQSEVRPIAGTQAPHVDTKPKRGRPKTILDMKAYKADKAKEYRAKKKAAK